jgi:hypothetical protein
MSFFIALFVIHSEENSISVHDSTKSLIFMFFIMHIVQASVGQQTQTIHIALIKDCSALIFSELSSLCQSHYIHTEVASKVLPNVLKVNKFKSSTPMTNILPVINYCNCSHQFHDKYI